MAFTSALGTLSLGYVTSVLRANARKNSFGNKSTATTCDTTCLCDKLWLVEGWWWVHVGTPLHQSQLATWTSWDTRLFLVLESSIWNIFFFLIKKIYPILVLLFLLLTSGESQLQSCNLFLIITIQQSNREVMDVQSEKIDLP